MAEVLDFTGDCGHIWGMTNQQEKPSMPDIPTNPDDLFNIMKNINVAYTLYEHDPIFTVEEGLHLKGNIPGLHCRNLFMKDKKGDMFLVVAANETQIDLKKLPKAINSGRLSFCSSDRLMTHLGIYPGAVCPFAVVNDKDQVVKVVLDQKMVEADLVCVHPLDNAMTVSLSPDDLLKFFNHTGHEPHILDMTDLAPDT